MTEQIPIGSSMNTASGSTPQSHGMVLPVILFLAALYFWDTAVVLPVKYLTVFFHELSHGLAAVLTGGQIVRIELSRNLGGVCWTAGGIRFIVITAGYLEIGRAHV